MKQKTYVITLSREFLTGHPRAGQPTGFADKFLANFRFPTYNPALLEQKKLHTIRANYDLWSKRFKKIAAGEACLSVRQWVGRPYAKGSTQIELIRLTKENGIGIQEVWIDTDTVDFKDVPESKFSKVRIEDVKYDYRLIPSKRLAENDGLSYEDWMEWFKGYKKSKSLAIIHFTSFRY